MAPIRCCQTAVWHSDAARGPSTPSFDHLVGAAHQWERHGDAERLRGLHVDDQLEFCDLLDRQVGRLLTFENPPGVDAKQAVIIRFTGSKLSRPPAAANARHWKIAGTAGRTASAASASLPAAKYVLGAMVRGRGPRSIQ